MILFRKKEHLSNIDMTKSAVIAALMILLLASCSSGYKAGTQDAMNQKTGSAITEASGDKQKPAEGTDQAQASHKPAEPSQKPAEPSKAPTAEKPAISPEAKQKADKLFEQGNVLYNNGDYEGAVKVLKQAVQSDPENYQAFNVLGVSQAFLGLYGEADKNIDQAIKLNPNFANATFSKAISMKLQKKYDEAIKYFDVTIRLNPNDVWSHYGKATIYSEREDVKNCTASLKIALDRDPGVKAAVINEPEFDPVRSKPEFQNLLK